MERITLNDMSRKKLMKELDKCSSYIEEFSYWNPDQPEKVIYNTEKGYRAVIIERLLQTGEVDVLRMAEELREEYGYLNLELFLKVSEEIRDICDTSGRNLIFRILNRKKVPADIYGMFSCQYQKI